MKIIQTLSHDIKSELSDAEKYIQKAIENKLMYPTISTMYIELAKKELDDAMTLHKHAVMQIEEARKTTTPPEYMIDLWNEEHKYLVAKASMIKNQLEMLRS